MQGPILRALQGEQLLRSGFLHRATEAFTSGLEEVELAKSTLDEVTSTDNSNMKDMKGDILKQLDKSLGVVLLGRARASYRLGKLAGALLDLNRVIELFSRMKSRSTDMDNFEVILRARQCLASVYILLGVDKLAENELELIQQLARKANIEGSLEGVLDAWVDPPPVTYSASDWHCARRIALVNQHPEVRKLLLGKRDTAGLSLVFSMLVLFGAQFTMAAVVGQMPFLKSMFWSAVLSPTLGACCAYGFQALNHELSHQLANRRANFVAMCIGSSLCNFPWAMYYSQYHARHHAYTGEAKDRDGDILFLPWHSPPTVSVNVEERLPMAVLDQLDKMTAKLPLRFEHFPRTLSWDLAANWHSRLVWSVISASLIYPLFSLRKYIYDTAHIPRIEFEGASLISHYLCWYLGGWKALLFLWTSASFSLGALGHPYLGFWLIQHACSIRKVDGSKYPLASELARRNTLHPKQPTVSYTGSAIWNRLNFSELLHVEHHDLPRTPCFRAERLSTIAPEFYQDLAPCVSIFGAIKEWVFAKSNREWMQQYGDFAGRLEHLYLEQLRDEQEQNDYDEEESRNTGDEEAWLIEEEEETKDELQKDEDDEEGDNAFGQKMPAEFGY